MANTNTNKTIKYTENDKLIVANLTGEMTLADLNAAIKANDENAKEIKIGSVNSAIRKGFVEVAGEREIITPLKKGNERTTYAFVTKEVLKNAEGKDFNYTDGEKEILGVLENTEDALALAEIAAALGKDKLGSGSINGLVKKGNVIKAGTKRMAGTTKRTVKTYVLVEGAATLVA